MHNFFSAINLIRFLLSQTSFLYLLIAYQLLIKPLRYAQTFAFNTVLASLSRKNSIETS